MSSGGFHVHGPHDHAVEHAAQGHGDPASGHGAEGGSGASINKIAMFTAIVATVGAIFSYMGGATQANAGLLKNDAAIKKTEASNQWNYFQSKSTKQALAELARDLTPTEPEKARYPGNVDRYEKEKNAIKTEAEKLEADALAFAPGEKVYFNVAGAKATKTTTDVLIGWATRAAVAADTEVIVEFDGALAATVA